VDGLFIDKKYLFFPGVKGASPNGSTIYSDCTLRYADLIDGSAKSVIMTQESVVFDSRKNAYVVLWTEQVEKISFDEDNRLNIEM
jgi:hypothetical protein